jgi:hypothetical protein
MIRQATHGPVKPIDLSNFFPIATTKRTDAPMNPKLQPTINSPAQRFFAVGHVAGEALAGHPQQRV